MHNQAPEVLGVDRFAARLRFTSLGTKPDSCGVLAFGTLRMERRIPMEAIWWAIIGIATAFLSRVLLPREDTDSTLLDVWAGAIGGVLGGYMVRTFGLSHSTNWFVGWSALLAFMGA